MDTEKRNSGTATQQNKSGLTYNQVESLSARKVLQPNFINPGAFDKTKDMVEKATAKKHQESHLTGSTASVVNPINPQTPVQPTAQPNIVKPVVSPVISSAVTGAIDLQKVNNMQGQVPPFKVPPVQVPPTQKPKEQFVPEPVITPRKTENKTSNIEIKLPDDEPIIKTERFSTANNDSSSNTAQSGETNSAIFAKKPVETKQHLPKKHKRWIIVLLLILLSLLAYLWLKPKGETVDSFQSQVEKTNTLPIEYQPLDQEQKPMVNNANTTEQTQNQEKPTDITLENPRPDGAPQTNNNEAANSNKRTMSLLVGDENKLIDSAANTTNENTTTPSTAVSALNTPVTPKESKESIAHNTATTAVPTTRVSPKATSNAEHRVVENAKPVVRSKADRPRTEPVRTADVRKSSSSDLAEKRVVKTPVVEAKPATYKAASTATNNSTKTTEAITGTTKVLTIPRGVSLMQVFRDNNLDIRDVNAMTKANGAGQILSNLHAGDRIRLIVSEAGQVKELRLSTGARFIRQKDGSYIYQK